MKWSENFENSKSEQENGSIEWMNLVIVEWRDTWEGKLKFIFNFIEWMHNETKFHRCISLG